MVPILTHTRLVLLSMWLGAAMFFSVVVAPTSFKVLRSFDLANASEIAGTIVTRALSIVNMGGFFIGLFLLVTLFASRTTRSGPAFWLEVISVGVIVIATGIGHWVIAARMRGLRIAMAVPIDQVALQDPRRIAFSNLHGYSVTALGLAMIAALVAIVTIARGLRS